MEKVKIDFDTIGYDSAMNKIKTIKTNIIPKLAVALNGYGIILDEKVFNSIIIGNLKSITDITQASFNSDIDKLSNPISKKKRNLQSQDWKN